MSQQTVRTLDRTLAPWPVFEPDEIEAVSEVMRSGKVNYWTGTEGREFEKEYAAVLGVPYVVALHNGTQALELALYALGVGAGDEVITTPRTFIASASAAVMRGAVPVIAEVDRDSGNITAETIRAVLTPRTRAIIVVHLAGWPADMDPIMALAREHNLYVIEDCAQAHGAKYHGQHVGTIGHIGCFSFCQDKIMTTGGEGGLLVTHDEDLWRKAWAFKDHGKSFDAVYNKEHPLGFRWLHESFGTNWRMLEVQAAIGRLQLQKLPAWTQQRQRNAAVLAERFSKLPALRVPVVPEGSEHAQYKYYVYVQPERLRAGWNRDRIMAEMVARGAPCYTGTCSEIYLEKAFVDAGLGPKERLPVARELGETSLMFLVHPTLSEADMNAIADIVEEVLFLSTIDF
ncbi:DegT/DnrJ/EryC1/StrS family aminotransferase [Deinococcus radiopugnans]|uniref:DegT/DnrJ/EryC1/StrS aminotransferase family protein n=1 Tax=Deinococcus radiopugnans ATCC 19172 TaxID=585398 RepID=A0A5C4Y7B0_9DEIO|nr:DegT/DnrJ/EryC1/StrS aminotransferase family protein [Deinococcus radiopugnans]MBB6017765.1 dTDP-4-amino-4,6-dideoxygalactose transaminase [Deinococcus radiopugnans ATCC 19172]TNM71430.1 DegT/DnrJ/EryC1/StrS aminotransferase family protein [Deinococcus radiopugnans ATCC 19172]